MWTGETLDKTSIRWSTLRIPFKVGMGAQAYQLLITSTWQNSKQQQVFPGGRKQTGTKLPDMPSKTAFIPLIAHPGQISQVQLNSDLTHLLVPNTSGGKQSELTLPGLTGIEFY